LTDDPGNRLPVARPLGYLPERYELALRHLESAKGALSLQDFIGLVHIPNRKADINARAA